MRILFICKKNSNPYFISYTKKNSGLFNSTRFIVEGLKARGVHAHIIEVVDNNCIDREVRKHKPDVVVIEALWVVPEKFHVLRKLHPTVEWFCHLHSHMPFLALEGSAIQWIRQYAHDGIVKFIANSPESYEALRAILSDEQIIFLPNVYIPQLRELKRYDCSGSHINIGCFGAVRPLKNQLLQALASIRFSRELRKPLRFHMNGTRQEMGGLPVLKNILQLFHKLHKSELILHKWMEPEDFIHFMHKEIDISLQVSLTETFNVVSADAVTAGIPIVVSKEIKWASPWSMAHDDSIDDIVKMMHSALNNWMLAKWNQELLLEYSKKAQEAWYRWATKT